MASPKRQPCQCQRAGSECKVAEFGLIALKAEFYCVASDDTPPFKQEYPTIEKDIEMACVRYAKKFGMMSYKMQTKGVRGWPDRSFYGPDGIHFLVEFKQPGKKPTPQQVAIIESLTKMGHDVWVIDDAASFRIALDAQLQEGNPF